MDGPTYLTLLIEHLGDVRQYLSDELSDRLDGLLEELRQAGDDLDDLDEITLRIADTVEPSLPDDHPVRVASSSGWRFESRGDGVGEDLAWGALLTRVRDLDLTAHSLTPENLLSDIHAFLLTAPAYRPDEVLDGHDPHLVRLRAEDGTPRVPAFQFDAEGLARPVVLMINRILDADEDPWGVADWWLSGNAWLGGAPAEMLGSGHDDELLAAAQAELGGI